MAGALIRAGIAALGLMLLAVPSEAARYLLSSSAALSWTPTKSPFGVTYTDTLSGSFDVDDGLDHASLGAGLTAFSINVLRQTDLVGSSSKQTYYATYSYGLADLTRFDIDLSKTFPRIDFYLNAGNMTALTDYNTFVFGARTAEPVTLGSLTATLAAVPEPASWAMMVAGFGLVGWAIRGRTRRAGPFAA